MFTADFSRCSDCYWFIQRKNNSHDRRILTIGSPEFGAKFQREVPLFLMLSEFPYNTGSPNRDPALLGVKSSVLQVGPSLVDGSVLVTSSSSSSSSGGCGIKLQYGPTRPTASRSPAGGWHSSAGWQITLCAPVWHVSTRSGVAGC